MKTVVINTTQDFHKYFSILKESARSNSVPDTFLVGFDTEFISISSYPESFKRRMEWIKSPTNDIACCVIQIASSDICLVINLVKMKLPLPNSLISIITSDSWIKVGVGIEQDLSLLSKNYILGHCGGGIEIKNLALLAHYPKPNLENLFNQFGGGHTKQISGMCDWSQELTEKQIIYAARDAIMSLYVFKKMINPIVENLINIKKNNNDILEIELINDNNKNNYCNNNDNNYNENFIGRLNEIAQAKKIDLPVYEEIIEKIGKTKMFKIKCYFNNNTTIGLGSSKKKAKHDASQKMYQKLSKLSQLF